MPSTSSESELWEALPGEPAKAFAAFKAYRDTVAKDRSVRKVCAAYYGETSVSKVNQWLRWSSQFQWVNRAKAWDAEQDRIGLETQRQAVKTMKDRHARQAMALQQKAIERLKDMKPEELGPKELLTYMIEAMKLERLARGEPETVTQENTRSVQTVVTVEKPESVDVDRVASIVRILAEAGAYQAGADGIDSAEADEVRNPPTNGKTNGFSAT